MSLTTQTPVTHAMILAAGRGERMRPLTDHTPKSMLRVRGKPLIQWHLESLARADIRHVVINLAHLGEQIADRFQEGRELGLTIRYSHEPEGALETAGGIALAKPWIDATGHVSRNPFLVVNADVFTDWPAHEAHTLAAQMRLHQAMAHLLFIDNPEHNLAGDFMMGQSLDQLTPKQAQAGRLSMGPAWVLAKPQAIPPAVSPPAANPNPHLHALTFSGIGVYDPVMFDSIKPGQRQALAPVLHQLIAQRLCMATHYRGQWTDVGTPERLASLQ